MRPPEPDPLPLRVDVLNGWPPYGPGDAVERVNRSSMVALQTLLSRVTCFAFNILRFMINGVKVADETFPSSYLSYFYLNLLRSDRRKHIFYIIYISLSRQAAFFTQRHALIHDVYVMPDL